MKFIGSFTNNPHPLRFAHDTWEDALIFAKRFETTISELQSLRLDNTDLTEDEQATAGVNRVAAVKMVRSRLGLDLAGAVEKVKQFLGDKWNS